MVGVGLGLVDFELVRFALVLMEENDGFGSEVVDSYNLGSLSKEGDTYLMGMPSL